MHGTRGFKPVLSIIWPPPDQTLIESVAGGDKQALEQLFTRHSARIYRFVLRITGNAALSEDIVSEVFLEVCGDPAVSRVKRKSRPGCSRSLATRRSRRSGLAGKNRPTRMEPRR